MKRIILISLALIIQVFATWYNPLVVADKESGLTIQDVISDGEGGAVVMWDEVGLYTSDNRYYLQRVDSTGRVLWDPGGVAVFDVPEYVDLDAPYIIRDDAGNYWVTVTYNLEDYYIEKDIYLQKISPSGKRLFGDRGIGVCTAERMQSSPHLCPSGDGVIVGWRDLRFYNYQPDDKVLCYAQRVGADASIRWPANGVLVADVSSIWEENCVTDGTGGAFFCISYANAENKSFIHFQHMDSLGSRLWGDSGILYSPGIQGDYMESDRDGGFIFDGPGGYQRINNLGQPVWDSAIAVEGIPSTFSPKGFFATYGRWLMFGHDGGFEELFASRVVSDGRCFTAQVWYYGLPQQIDIVGDGALDTRVSENGIIVWKDSYYGYFGILSQRLDTLGKTLWTGTIGFGFTAMSVCGPSGDRPFVVAIPDDGAIVFWQDTRNGSADIYATKLDANGTLPPGITEPPPPSSEMEVAPSIGSEIVLRYSNCADGFSASVFDASGREIDKIESSSTSGTLEWPVTPITHECFGSGVYFILAEGSNRSPTKIVLVR